MNIRFTWDEVKRARNVQEHGFDFVDAPMVFEGVTVTYEDDRFDYGERRFITLGIIGAVPVSIVHTETSEEIHVISFRKATRQEIKILYESI